MGTSLTGLKIKDSYSGLLKTTDNGALGASAKQITDGLGNASPLYVNTDEISINDSVSGSVETNYAPKLLVGGQIMARSLTSGDALISIGGDSDGAFISAGKQDGTLTSRNLRVISGTTEIIRITNSGITFNGDTSSANALGDYEEGTWTPQISNGTIDVAVSHTGSWYIKIGSLVTVSTRITNADLSSFALGDNPQIIGLPFTSSATSYSTVFLRGAVAGNILRYIQTVGSSSSILTDLTVSELISGTTDYFLTITYTV
jgi:hypothetical protein